MFRKGGRYFALGATLVAVVLISSLFILIFSNLGTVFQVVRDFLGIISSVIFGLLFAYLMNPLMKAIETPVYNLISRGNMPERSAKKVSHIIGVGAAVLIFVAVIYALIASVVPEVISSLGDLLSQSNLDNYYNKITEWTDNFLRDTPLEKWFAENGGNVLQTIQNWLTKEIDIAGTISSVAGQAFGMAKGVFNAIIGLVVAVYMLGSKDKFLAQAKKLTVAVFRPARANRVLELARRANGIFGGFIVGKIIDSFIIGLLCYIGTLIIGVPYAMLISVFMGITNIIPFFGPLLGVACGTILILLQSPLKALYYLIFALVLQQVDGNIIGPRILGERLGVSNFWIVVSIMVFGGLFGVPGMFLGAPVFAFLYSLVADAVHRSLKKRQLPMRTEVYCDILSVEDLERYQREEEEGTTFYAANTYDLEYDPEDDIEYDDDYDDEGSNR